jgi:ribosome-associated protein
MNTEKIQSLAITALEDLKAIDLVAIDVREMTTITDVMIICSGRSNRHVKSLAESVSVAAKQAKVSTVRMEGEREAEWVIVDLGDVVVHVMIPAAREFYHLEDLWEPIKKQREKQG